jgi:CubicO group peptidase (beta-lactamase class C family)
MKSYLKFLLLLSFSAQLFASSGWNEKDLSEIYKYVNESGFNGAILVSHQEKLIVEEYLGYADSEKTTELTRQHLFSPGSVGKEFTTVGIMMLEDQGLLSYEDKVSKFLTELPEWAKNVTIHQILNHTSGFPKIKWKKKYINNRCD